MRLGIQLYTLRNLDESLPETIRRVGDTPFEGVQMSGLGDTTPAEVASALAASDLDVAGAHVGFDEMRDDYEETLARYDELGCDEFVVPSYDSEAFESESAAREAGRDVASLVDLLAADGVGLHYHNHTFEFTPLDDGTAFDAFVDAAGVDLEIDTGLANHGGADSVALLERYGDRVSLVHLTDSRSGSMDTRHVDLGTGEVDLEACVDACTEADVDWLIFEHGLTDEPIQSMETAADVLLELG